MIESVRSMAMGRPLAFTSGAAYSDRLRPAEGRRSAAFLGGLAPGAALVLLPVNDLVSLRPSPSPALARPVDGLGVPAIEQVEAAHVGAEVAEGGAVEQHQHRGLVRSLLVGG